MNTTTSTRKNPRSQVIELADSHGGVADLDKVTAASVTFVFPSPAAATRFADLVLALNIQITLEHRTVKVRF